MIYLGELVEPNGTTIGPVPRPGSTPRTKEERMREILEKLGVHTDRCIMGACTDTPCPFPATEPVSRWEDSEATAHLCAYHAATEPLVEDYDDLSLALELLKEWEEAANEHGNRPLVDVLFRARLELGQRRELVAGVVEDLESAEKRRFVGSVESPTGRGAP
jgi:hypothetical protein